MQTIVNLKKQDGQRFKKTVHGAFTVEDWPDMKAVFIDSVQRANLEYTDNGDSVQCNGTLLRSPKLKKESFGTVTFLSKNYYFTDEATGLRSYGDAIRKDMLTDQGFRLFLNAEKTQYIEYTLV